MTRGDFFLFSLFLLVKCSFLRAVKLKTLSWMWGDTFGLKYQCWLCWGLSQTCRLSFLQSWHREITSSSFRLWSSALCQMQPWNWCLTLLLFQWIYKTLFPTPADFTSWGDAHSDTEQLFQHRGRFCQTEHWGWGAGRASARSWAHLPGPSPGSQCLTASRLSLFSLCQIADPLQSNLASLLYAFSNPWLSVPMN